MQKSKLTIFDNDETGDTDDNQTRLNINKEFAQKFETGKQKQELARLREKYGNSSDLKEDSDGDDDDDLSSEDELGEEVTPAIDVQVMKTIAAIRSRDPSVYDKEKFFFDQKTLQELDSDAKKKNLLLESKKESKPFLIRDYHRQALMDGQIPGAMADRSHVKTHAEEQEELRQALKNAVDANISEEDSDSDLFTAKTKSKEESKVEEEAYNKWLLENMKKDEKTGKVFGDWLKYQQDSTADIDNGEKFLSDFIFNRGWVDKTKEKIKVDSEIDEEDEEYLSEAAEFEQKYNFRFEEIEALHGPGSSYSNLYGITTHARDVPGSVRRLDSTRTEKRKQRESRKEVEKMKKIEEIKRLKTLKRKEIEEIMEKLEKSSGVDIQKHSKKMEEMVEEMDNEEEFDSDKWDQMMGKVFGESYYENVENEKPIFSDEENNEDDYEISGENENTLDSLGEEVYEEDAIFHNGEDSDASEFIMDADYLDELNGKKVKEEKQAIETVDTSRLSKLREEYENLQCEDVVAGIPCRFKYEDVEKDNFGLSAEEILMADDTLLNEYISLKKLAPYRSSEYDQEWMKKWKHGKKKRRKMFREKLLETLKTLNADKNEDIPEEEAVPKDEKKKKSKKEKREGKDKRKEERKRKKSKDFNEKSGKKSKSRLSTYGL